MGSNSAGRVAWIQYGMQYFQNTRFAHGSKGPILYRLATCGRALYQVRERAFRKPTLYT